MSPIVSLLVFGFFAFILGAGFLAVRNRPNTLEEYALASMSLPPLLVAVGWTATRAGVNDLIMFNVFFNSGIEAYFVTLGFALNLFFLGTFVFPKLIGKGYMTAGDVLEPTYGKGARVCAGLMGLLFCCLSVMGQLIALGDFAELLELRREVVIGVVGLVVVLYTVVGGVRSVTITDCLQLALSLTALIMLLNLVSHKTKGLYEIFAYLGKHNPRHLAPWSNGESGWALERLRRVLFWTSSSLFISPALCLRYFMVREKEQIKKLTRVSIFAQLAFLLLIMTLAFGSYMLTEGKGYSGGQLIFVGLVKSLLTGNSLGPACLALAALSLLMAAIDSLLHAASIVAVRDVLSPVLGSQVAELKWVRLSAVLLGSCFVTLAMMVTQYPSSLNAVGLSVMSVLALPFIATAFGLRGSPAIFRNTVLSFFCTAGLVACLWHDHFYARAMQEHRNFYSIYIRQIWEWASVASIVVFFLSHYLSFKGFVTTAEPQGVRQLIYRAGCWTGRKIMSSMDLADAARGRVCRYGMEWERLSLFMLCFYMLPSPTATVGGAAGVGAVISIQAIVRLLGIGICLALVSHPLWTKSARRLVPLFYYFAIWYCVPFTFSMVFLSDPSDTTYFVCFVFSFLLLAQLVDVSLFFFLHSSGMLSALVVRRLFSEGWLPAGVGAQTKWSVAGAIFLAMVLVAAFGRRREKKLQRLQHLLSREEKYLAAAHLRALTCRTHFARSVEAQCLDELEASAGELLKNPQMKRDKELGMRLMRTAETLRGVARSRHGSMAVDCHPIPLVQLVEETFGLLEQRQLDVPIRVYIAASEEMLYCDIKWIRELLDNSLQLLHNWSPDVDGFVIHINDVKIAYVSPGRPMQPPVKAIRIVLATTDAQVTAAEAEYAIQVDEVGQRTDNILIDTNLRIVRAHHGKMTHTSQLFTYVLPVCPGSGEMSKPEKVSPADGKGEASGLSPEEKHFCAALQGLNIPAERIIEAMGFIRYYHMPESGQLDFYRHSVAVAEAMLPYTRDVDTLLTALVHSAVEDTKSEFFLIEAVFGVRVVQLFAELKRVETILREAKGGHDQSYLSRLDFEGSMGRYALLIRIMDQMHHLRTGMEGETPEQQKKRATELQSIYVQLAHRLGYDGLAKELEHLAREVLDGSESVRE